LSEQALQRGLSGVALKDDMPEPWLTELSEPTLDVLK
jgi:hypothetical protein